MLHYLSIIFESTVLIFFLLISLQIVLETSQSNLNDFDNDLYSLRYSTHNLL